MLPLLPALASSHSEGRRGGGGCGALVRAGGLRGRWVVGKVDVSDKRGQTDLVLVGPASLNFPNSAGETHPGETASFQTHQDFVGADWLLVSNQIS